MQDMAAIGRLGGRPSKLSLEDRERITLLISEGKDWFEICKLTGASEYLVLKAINQHLMSELAKLKATMHLENKPILASSIET